MGLTLPRGHVGEPGGGLFTSDSKRQIQKGFGKGMFLSTGAPLGDNLERAPLQGLERKV